MKKIVLIHCITVILLASLYANGTGEVSSHKKANTALLVIDKYGILTDVTDSEKLKGKLILPAEVKKIGKEAFADCWRVTEVDFSACTGLTEIGELAFSRCSGLTRVDLSDCTNLTGIGFQAFEECTRLTSIDLSGCTNLSKIGYRAFQGCTGLTEVRLPVSLNKIDGNIFDRCRNLHTLTVDPANQAYCSKDTIIYTKDMKTLVCAAKDITQVVIPDTITEIGSYAFESCIGLTKLDLSAYTHLISIEEHAFARCTGLTELKLPENITHTGLAAFFGCTRLKSIDLFACINLRKIGEHAFRDCISLTELDFLYTNLTEIGELAFYNCHDLRKVTFSSSLRKIGKSAFSDCRNLQKIYFLCTDLREIGKDAFPASKAISIFTTEENTDTIANLLEKIGFHYTKD